MALDSLDQVVKGVAAGSAITLYQNSVSNTGAGAMISLWTAGGFPAAGSTPTAASIYTDLAVGGLPIRQCFSSLSSTGNIYQLNAIGATINQWYLYDRLIADGSHMCNTTALHNVNIFLSTMANTGRCMSCGCDVDWFVENYADAGVTQITVTIQALYSDGTAYSQSLSFGGASPLNRKARLTQIPPLNEKYIAAILSTRQTNANAAAGGYGITAMKRLAFANQMVANVAGAGDWASIGLPQIMATSCLQFVALASTTSTGVLAAYLKIAPTP